MRTKTEYLHYLKCCTFAFYLNLSPRCTYYFCYLGVGDMSTFDALCDRAVHGLFIIVRFIYIVVVGLLQGP